jgi:small subunit ribosomal protein S15
MSKKALVNPKHEELPRLHQTDTGSTPVQVTNLTNRILHLTEHFKVHGKDLHSKKGLIALVNKRKKLLKYFKLNNKDQYLGLIKTLKLRDSY